MSQQRNSVNVFATRADLEPGVRAIESVRKLQYVLCGLFDSAALTAHGSLLEAEDLGVNRTGQHITGPCYLVADALRRIEVRVVPQRRGGTKYAVDQLDNPGSITILPGGLYQNCLLAGQIGTIGTDDVALTLFRDYSQEVTRGFKKVKEYRVGPEAVKLLDRGTRLTTSAKSPSEYDLKI